ncbi:phosphatidate cytidylyltransferase [Alicyclobacillus hesperidum URH17-3-68]|uniref:Phosphatidate cytidylyltransferase n=1 Tax=Alicyclobacillus hesperidum TaxID=89784 RepID=A0A1H2SI87_9BACL|nr:phosphatidate cytidylyltransferase [Alicyclobacillus hesperidum]EJY55614.1 phosphatidate cytidylyltransferase [Alicyclobacillus hesperidum URH17-3-68]GLV12392.1 phosphatidate cytidylyltransferase [Alicyclobacillus hesperidum]SDW31331.1 phosphatidate cytidylyltransferase [Alicyclobacillus hesperidum]
MLKQRVITAVIAGLVVLFVLLFGGTIGWRWLVWMCTVAGVVEFSVMFGRRWYGPPTVFGALLVTLIEWFPHALYHPFLLYLIVAIVFAVPVFTRSPADLKPFSMLVFGALYIGAGGFALIGIRELPVGWFWLWLFLISIWMSDTAAYFVGRFLGGPKLLPAISPGKTISGMVGGIVGAAVGACVFGWIAHPMHVGMYALLGALISVTGQLGDLIESAYKRSAGVKDSGKLLPGHGGLLDRIDSLLFAAPFALWMVEIGLHGWFGV